jgi:hypothetical protein
MVRVRAVVESIFQYHTSSIGEYIHVYNSSSQIATETEPSRA